MASTRVLLALSLTLACCLAAAYLITSNRSSLQAQMKVQHRDWDHFAIWMSEHGKQYQSEVEMMKRFGIFISNKAIVEAHNADNLNWTMGINQFADLTSVEFVEQHLGLMGSSDEPKNYAPMEDVDVPASKDWTTQGIVVDVKNQGSCGSCWAFSTVASVESAYAQKTSRLVALSEQQLVDCSHNGNLGCFGGLMDKAFTYLKSHSLMQEHDYPYKGFSLPICHAKESKGVAHVTGYHDIPSNELALKQASALRVVSVGVDATTKWQLYKGGVFDGKCGDKMNHGVTLVGYGETSAGAKFWKIKNSWGTVWGEQGFIRLARTEGSSSGGLCAVAENASYPNL